MPSLIDVFVTSWKCAKGNWPNHNRRTKQFGEIIIIYSVPFLWYFLSQELSQYLRYWIRDVRASIRPDKRWELGTKLRYSGGLAIMMVKDPAYIWENGKKRGITNEREAKEYAKRRGLVMGGDDLEQEADHNKKTLEEEHTNKITDNIMRDIERRGVFRG